MVLVVQVPVAPASDYPLHGASGCTHTQMLDPDMVMVLSYDAVQIFMPQHLFAASADVGRYSFSDVAA